MPGHLSRKQNQHKETRPSSPPSFENFSLEKKDFVYRSSLAKSEMDGNTSSMPRKINDQTSINSGVTRDDDQALEGQTATSAAAVARKLAIVARLPKLPGRLKWPLEEYRFSPEAHTRGGIIRYLERVWQPLIQAGYAERRIVAELDPSVIDGIKSFTRDRDGSKVIPEHLLFLKVGEAKAIRTQINDTLVLARINAPSPK